MESSSWILRKRKAGARLANDPSTHPDPNFLPIVEGQPLFHQEKGQSPQPFAIGSDGIAISADGSRLYYSPLSSRQLYSVSTDALRNRKSRGRPSGSDHQEGCGQGRLGTVSNPTLPEMSTPATTRAIPSTSFARTATSRPWRTTRAFSGPTHSRWPTTAISISPPTNSRANPVCTAAPTCGRSLTFCSGIKTQSRPVRLQ